VLVKCWYALGGVLMSKRNNRVVTYLTDDEYGQLKEWADEADKPLSQLLRQAVLEYTDKDRLLRMEDKIDTLLAYSENGTHTHTKSNNSVPEKARAIAQHIYKEHSPPIKEDDVELAIENIADVGDERSVEKYKSQLKKRQLLFCHPFQPVWTDKKQQWVKWVEQSDVADQSHEIADEYNMSISEYEQQL